MELVGFGCLSSPSSSLDKEEAHSLITCWGIAFSCIQCGRAVNQDVLPFRGQMHDPSWANEILFPSNHIWITGKGTKKTLNIVPGYDCQAMTSFMTLWRWLVPVFASSVFQLLFDLRCPTPYGFRNPFLFGFGCVLLLSTRELGLSCPGTWPYLECHWALSDGKGGETSDRYLVHVSSPNQAAVTQMGRAGQEGKWKHSSVPFLPFLVPTEPNLPASRIPVGATPNIREPEETPPQATPPEARPQQEVPGVPGVKPPPMCQTQRERRGTQRPPSLKGKRRMLSV